MQSLKPNMITATGEYQWGAEETETRTKKKATKQQKKNEKFYIPMSSAYTVWVLSV